MPSGAKKRKANKKKKEKEANINPSISNPQGDDVLKSQDEKGSDGGEGDSPSYHDHDDHHHPFNEGNNEEVEERDPAAAQPSAADAKSVEEVPGDIKIDEVVEGKEDGSVMMVRDFKSKESHESNVVHFESTKETDYGNRSSNGSSNYESLAEKISKDERYNSFKDTTTFDELVKSIDSSHAKMTLITESAPVEETGNSVVESSVNSAKGVVSMSEVKSNDTRNASLEKSPAYPIGAAGLDVKNNEDKVYPVSYNNVGTFSLEGTKTMEYISKASASLSGSAFIESTDVAEHVKDSETPECSENQPLVASAPPMVQKTSWLSCCGLFEVLSGSNR